MRCALRPESHLDWMISRQRSQSLMRPRCRPRLPSIEAGTGKETPWLIVESTAVEPMGALAGFDSTSAAVEPMGALAGFDSTSAAVEPVGALAGFDSALI